jgi:hypothetical protein
MAFKDNKTVGEEVTSILRNAKVKINESALKECGMDWQAPLQQQQEDRYNLTITTNDKTVTVSTTNPEDIIHMMKLGGVEVGSHSVEPATDIGYGSGELTGLGLPGMGGEPAHDEPVGVEVLGTIDAGDVEMGDDHEEHETDDEEAAEHDDQDEDEEDDEVEESGDWGNTPAGSDGQARSHGDIADQSAAGTGEGNKNYGQNKAPGQGDNPLAFESMMESYKKFKANEGVMDKVKAFGKKALDTLGHGDDEELIKDLQKKSGVPQTGKKPESKDKVKEAKSKPDFLDVDKDGDKKEPMKKAIKDKKSKTNESAEQLAYMRKLAGLK